MKSAAPPSLTQAAACAPYDELLSAMTPGERFLRALALTSYVRGLCWQGAALATPSHDPLAIRERFLCQLYGNDFAREVLDRLNARESA